MFIRKGFTLVELLVVIAIIGLLSTVAIVTLTSTRQNSRDTRRIVDLATIHKALALYYADNGYYPPSPCGYDCNGYNASYDSNWDTLAAALSPYISKLPKDPINAGCLPWNGPTCYSYAYGNVGRNVHPKTYDLATQLESTNNPNRCGVKNWTWGLGLYGSSQQWCGVYTTQMYETPPHN